jgi:hypothetical protein
MTDDATNGLRQRVEAMVLSNWTALAGMAWRCYMQYGPGAALITVAQLELWEKASAGFKLEPPYITAGIEGLEAVLRSYDPKVSIVIAITSDLRAVAAPAKPELDPEPIPISVAAGSTFGAWIFSGGTPPPMVHGRQAS